MSARVAILGAGAAGLGAAAALPDHDVVIYDRRSSYGGHASSFETGGFTFDEGPHISFTRDEGVRAMFAEATEGQYQELPGIALNYFEGYHLKHPAQCHLFPLPAEIRKACLVDFMKAQLDGPATIRTYRDWCYRQFGQSFSETFVRRYTRKYWTVELEELTADWVGPRIHSPQIEEVVDGALREVENNYYYISTFRYPRHGGFVSFFRKLAEGKRILTDHEVTELDPRRRRLRFKNGKAEHYDCLISSLPLPTLIRLIPEAPSAIRDDAARLQCTSHFLVNVGLRGETPTDAYWIYYYDEDIPFSRVSFPAKLSPHNAPVGHWSLQAEVVHGPRRPLGDPAAVLEATMHALERVGLVRRRDDVVVVDTLDIPYANVIFDLEREPRVRAVRDYLTSLGIAVCGRYGEWAYLWTDESIRSGERAAREVATTIATGAVATPR